MAKSRAYTSQWHGWRSFVTTIWNDIKAYRSDPKKRVTFLLEEARSIEQLLFGHPLTGADILDIGPGAVPVQLAYFSRNNHAVGIDINEVIHHRTPWALLRIARESGPLRAVKTLGRWVLGSDEMLRRSVAQCLGMETLSWPPVFQMDVEHMSFPDESFDFVYSRSVLHHLRDPSRAIQEIGRVLRLGGRAHISLHLWTCPNGFTYVPARSWEWPHLTGQLLFHEIDQSRNRLRLEEWRNLFGDGLPGCEFTLRGPEIRAMIDRASVLRETELADYSLEELINYELAVSWRKH